MAPVSAAIRQVAAHGRLAGFAAEPAKAPRAQLVPVAMHHVASGAATFVEWPMGNFATRANRHAIADLIASRV